MPKASARFTWLPPTDQAQTLELLQTIRLACPSLPVGAFAYSQGLEYAVDCGWVTGPDSAQRWISGLLTHSVGNLDLPRLQRLYLAWAASDFEAAKLQNQLLLAARESSELVAEELHLGSALKKLLVSLDTLPEGAAEHAAGHGYLSMFALAGVCFGLSFASLSAGFCFAWLEHQVSAATRLIPLGQTDGQRILSSCLGLVPGVIQHASSQGDWEIGAAAPGQALASALHETQYTRLFRS